MDFCIHNLQTFSNTSKSSFALDRLRICPGKLWLMPSRRNSFWVLFMLFNSHQGNRGLWGRWADEIFVNKTYLQGCSWGRPFMGIYSFRFTMGKVENGGGQLLAHVRAHGNICAHIPIPTHSRLALEPGSQSLSFANYCHWSSHAASHTVGAQSIFVCWVSFSVNPTHVLLCFRALQS